MRSVDLGEGFPTHICLQNLASIQPRTYALSDASYGFFPAFSSRQRAQDFLSNNPAAPAVRALTAAEAASLVEDGVDLTDNQARIFPLRSVLIYFF